MKFSALAALAAVAVAAPTPDANTSGLTVDLKLISNTEVKAVITNTGKDELKLLSAGTILSKAPTEKVAVFSGNGPVGFNGAHVRVMKEYLDATAFQTLAAGGTIETTFDLASMYDLSQGGDFTIQANSSIAIGGPDYKLYKNIPYISNIIEMHVNGAQAATSRLNAYNKRANAHCDGGRRTVLTNAMRRCRELAATAQYEAAQGQASRMNEYYKNSDAQTRRTVSEVFRKVGEVCSTMNGGYAGIYCSDIHRGCDGGAVALTYSGESNMILCDSFFNAIPASSNQCHNGDQGSVLVHEATHLSQVKGTGDYGYGYDSVKKNSAATNLNHADAYTYFSKSFYETCSNSGDPGSYQVYICRDTIRRVDVWVYEENLALATDYLANVPSDFMRQVSSLGGSYQRDCFAFKDPNCKGQNFKIAKGQQMNSIPNGLNDNVSSFRC